MPSRLWIGDIYIVLYIPEVKPMNIRERYEELERQNLSEFAVLSSESRGRAKPEDECDIRTAFQRDKDRIIYSKSFRRLLPRNR